MKTKVTRNDNWEGRSNSPVCVNLGDTWNRKLFYVRFFVTIWFQVRFLGTVDLVFCPVTSIQGVPGLVTLLILVLLGKLLVTLDDVGALGFASSLYSEKLKDIFTKPFSSWILPWTSQPPWPWGRGSLPATSSSSGSSPDCRQFAFHSYPGFWKSYRWHKNRRRRRWSENWIAKQVRHSRCHDQGQH